MFGFGGRYGKRMGAGPGFAGGPFEHFRDRFGGGSCGPFAMLNDLGLSDEQLERLAELKMEALTQFAQLKVAFGPMIKQMMRELCQDEIDKPKVKELGKKMQALKAQAGDEFLDRIIALAEVLTPQQRKKLRMKAIRRFLGINPEQKE